jgi:hypothetical protein
MSDKNLFEAIERRDLKAVSEMIHKPNLQMDKCFRCGSFSLQAYHHNRDTFSVHCFNEFSTKYFDCDAPPGPECADPEESIRLWNVQQQTEADLRARLSLEQRDETRESWSNIDSDSGMPKQGPI